MNKAICSQCEKVISDNEEMYARMKYPKFKKMVEIKAFLQKECDIVCKTCFESK